MKLSEARAKSGYRTAKIFLGSCFMDKTQEDFKTEKEFEDAQKIADPDAWIEIRLPTVDEVQEMADKRFVIPDGIDIEKENVLNIILDRAEKRSDNDSSKQAIKRSLDLCRKLFVKSSFEDDKGGEAPIDEVFDLIRTRLDLTMRMIEGLAVAMGKLTAQNKQS